MNNGMPDSTSTSGTRYRFTPYAGQLPQIVLYLDRYSKVLRCDKSLAGSTFKFVPDMARLPVHEFIHKECTEKCDLSEVLDNCTARLMEESIVEVETYDRVLGKLLRLRFVLSASAEDGRTYSILHIMDITAGREVTFSLQDTNKHLSELFEEKQSELKESRQRISRHQERLKDMNVHLKTLSSRLIVAQEQERSRISTDLHDGVGQHLSLARYCLDQAIGEARQHETQPAVVDAMDRSLKHLDSSIQEVRRIARNLKPSMLEEFGIVATLELLIHEFESAHIDIDVSTSIKATVANIPADQSVAIVRIFQEALNNITSHSEATAVELDVKLSARDVRLRIFDNGIGFLESETLASDRSRPQYGLSNMRDRAQSTGGKLSISSAPGSGTTISAAWLARQNR